MTTPFNHIPAILIGSLTQEEIDNLPLIPGMTTLNNELAAMQTYMFNNWASWVMTDEQPAFGDTLTYNPYSNLWHPTPAISPYVESLKVYGDVNANNALHVYTAFSVTPGGHPTSTGSVKPIGIYTGPTVNYTITIDSVGTLPWDEATFTWTDGTTTETAVPVALGTTAGRKVLSPITLSNGLQVMFTQGSYVNGETWTFGAFDSTTRDATPNLSVILGLRAAEVWTPTGNAVKSYGGIYADYPGANGFIGMLAGSGRSVLMFARPTNSDVFGVNAAGRINYDNTGYYEIFGQAAAPAITIDTTLPSVTGSFNLINRGITFDELAADPAAFIVNQAHLFAKDKAGATIPYWRNPTSTYEFALVGLTSAPVDAQYLVLAANGVLTVERVFTPGTALSAVDGGAGAAYTLNHAATASGDLHTEYVRKATLTTAGDMYYATGAATVVRLGIGSAGQYLRTTGTTPTWTTVPFTDLTGTISAAQHGLFTTATASHDRLIDSGSTTRVLLATSSPHVVVTGDMDVSGHMALGTSGTVSANQFINMTEAPPMTADFTGSAMSATLTLTANRAFTFIGRDLIAASSGSFNLTGSFTGARNLFLHDSAGSYTTVYGGTDQIIIGGLFSRSTTNSSAPTIVGRLASITLNRDGAGGAIIPTNDAAGLYGYINNNILSAGGSAQALKLSGVRSEIVQNAGSSSLTTAMYLFEGIASSVLLGTITNAYGMYLPAWPAGPTYTNGPWGVYQVGTTSINWFAGKTRLGGSAGATERLDVAGGNIRIEGGSSTGYIDIGEYATTTDAAAPSDNRVRVYCRDNGAGKEQLIARFATGAVVVIATEP